MTDHWRLLADVGGTNVRFGRSLGGLNICDTCSWPVSTFDSFETALRTYLATLDEEIRFASVAIAAAGPTSADKIAITNNDWIVTSDDIRGVLGHEVTVKLLNDLEAVAYALPYLSDNQVGWIDSVRGSSKQAQSKRAQRMLAVNVGTGFGSATIIGTSEGWVSCPAESGHMHLSVCDDHELTLLSKLGAGRLTNEDILSGDGVRRLWSALAISQAGSAATMSLADHALDFADPDPISNETLRYFSTFLARAISDLVLAAAAWDGVYLCGSVAIAWSHSADHIEFRRAFVGASKMRHLLAETPISLIRPEVPAFVGLANVDVPPR